MAKYIQTGRVINYRNEGTEPIKWGDVVVLTEIIGIAAIDIAPQAMGTVELSGVYEIEAETTSAFTVGQQLYWDRDKACLTAVKTESGAIIAGRAIDEKTASAVTALVKIGG